MSYASIAENVDLRSGSLRPWVRPAIVANGPDGTRAASLVDGKWVFDGNDCTVWVTSMFCPTHIRSGPCDYPYTASDPCGDWCRLGCPTPRAPTVSDPNAHCELHTETAAYVIVYGDGGNCGAPSPMSNVVLRNAGDTIQVELPDPPDDTEGWCITEVKVYRLSDTWDVSKGMHESNGGGLQQGFFSGQDESAFFLVATLPITATTFTDQGDDGECLPLGEPLIDWQACPPRHCLTICGETLSGSMVGFACNELWFSRRNSSHAWPASGCIKLPCEIRGIHVTGNRVLVLTDGQPYIVTDNPEMDEQLECRQVLPVEAPAPVCSHKAVTGFRDVAVFVTRVGVMLLATDGTVQNLTAELINERDWRQYDPESMSIAIHDGMVFVAGNKFSGILDTSLPYAGARQAARNITTLSFCPKCWITDKAGCLYALTEDGDILQWEAGDDYLTYQWRSVVWKNTSNKLIAAIKPLYADAAADSPCPTTLRVFKNTLGGMTRVLGREATKLRAFRADQVQLELSGQREVCALSAGSTADVQRGVQYADDTA